MPPTKFVATTGKNKWLISLHKREVNLTFAGIISAAGRAVPPVFEYLERETLRNI